MPVIRAVEALQSEKPSGLKIGPIREPSFAKILWELSETILKPRSKLWRNQMTMDAMKMMVNARWRKSFAFSHIRRRTLLGEGIR